MTNNIAGAKKLSLKEDISKGQAELMARIWNSMPFSVLDIAYWNCVKPWNILERKINDNFCVFIESGAMRFRYRDEERILQQGDVVIIPEFEPHSFGLTASSESVSHFVFHALFDNVVRENPFYFFDSPFQKLSSADSFLENLRRIVMMRAHHPETAALQMESLFKDFLLEKAYNGHFIMKEAEYSDQRIPAALKYINNNFTSNISIGDIAAHVGLKEVRFRRLFNNDIGISPSVFLVRKRISHAKQLLIRDKCTVAKAALSSGFSSESYFCTVFQQVNKCTPSQFRKMFFGKL